MSSEPDLEALRALAVDAARQAGALLSDGLGRSRTEVSTKSTGTDMVTEMDRASEAMLAGILLGARPDDGILGEEGADQAGRSGIRWVVDPLDGTTNYLYGFPGFNVSIAAELHGETVVGVVLDVVRQELFTAVRGGGAQLDGRTICTTGATVLGQALVGTGFAYDPERRRRQAQVLVEVLPEIRDVRRQGAAALDLCSVACGRLDAYYELGLAPWDLAAGGLIAAEAGADVSELGDDVHAPGSVLASAPGIAGDLGRLLTRAGAHRA